MPRQPAPVLRRHLSRRTFLKGSVAAGAAAASGGVWATAINHRFDAGTPVGGNYQAAAPGASSGPPAPPRDASSAVGDLFDCFTF